MRTTLENSWSDTWGNFPRCSGIVTSIGEWGQDNEERGWQLQIKQSLLRELQTEAESWAAAQTSQVAHFC